MAGCWVGSAGTGGDTGPGVGRQRPSWNDGLCEFSGITDPAFCSSFCNSVVASDSCSGTMGSLLLFFRLLNVGRWIDAFEGPFDIPFFLSCEAFFSRAAFSSGDGTFSLMLSFFTSVDRLSRSWFPTRSLAESDFDCAG